jgi:two-component system, chemotaxis family, chemotaxis protein CheY
VSIDYSQLRVLIVDADNFTRSIVKNVLEELGFQSENIHETGSGVDGLELLRVKTAHIAICSKRMGSIDGVEFVRTIRDPEQCSAPGIAIIFCSQQLNKTLVEEIREAGVNEVIAKPITIGAVQSRIQHIFEKPRPMVTIKDYVGPDRRRVDNGDRPRERRSQKRE